MFVRALKVVVAVSLGLLAEGCLYPKHGSGHTVLAPMAGPGEHSTVQPVVESGGQERLPAPTALDCPLEGKWFNTTTGLGQSTITIATQADGRNKATEQGLGYFEGSAEIRGKVLEIIFRRSDGSAGYYEWTLDASCTKGEGKLVFTAVSRGQHPSTVKRLP